MKRKKHPDFKETIIMLLSVALAGSVWAGIYQKPKCPEPECPQPEVDISCPEPKCPEPEVTTSCPDCPERSILKKIISNMEEEHNYKLDKYDCTEYSYELEGRLEDKGFDARTKAVSVKCSSPKWDHWDRCEEYNGKHRIVEVDDIYIESTTGKIVDPQDYKSYGIE